VKKGIKVAEKVSSRNPIWGLSGGWKNEKEIDELAIEQVNLES
jgi:hypothetical protein